MKNGLYVSAYLHIDGLSRAIEWWQRHDQNLSLWELRDGSIKLLRYWELERITGQKQHSVPFQDISQGREFLRKILKDEGVELEDVVAIFGTPGLDTVQNYSSLAEFPNTPYHTVCHLFSAIGMNGCEALDDDVLALALDGGPDRLIDSDISFENEYAAAIIKNGAIQLVPLLISPGRLWYLARERFSMKEGSLMALQTASEARFEASPISSVDLDSFPAILKWLEAQWDAIEVVEYDTSGISVRDIDLRFTERENRISMAVKVLHDLSIAIVVRSVDALIAMSNLIPERTTLAIAGGFGLNCPTNRYLLERYRFKKFLAPPCVNDAGISLGAALYFFWKNNPKSAFELDRADYGPPLSRRHQGPRDSTLMNYIEIQPMDAEQCARDILAGPIIWIDGGCEIGPRALGHRSLIGDPRTLQTRQILNEIKQRQWWRPVAPIILDEEVRNWFVESDASPYMLLTSKVLRQKHELVPAVVHLDGTARLQTVTSGSSLKLLSVLRSFYRLTGVPMLANTSLNDRGEPIINDLERVLQFAVAKHVAIIYLNGDRIFLDLRYRDVFLEKLKPERPYAELLGDLSERESEVRRRNPNGVPLRALQTYCRLPLLRKHFDITLPADARKITEICAELELKRSKEYGTTAHSALLRATKELLSAEQLLSV